MKLPACAPEFKLYPTSILRRSALGLGYRRVKVRAQRPGADYGEMIEQKPGEIDESGTCIEERKPTELAEPLDMERREKRNQACLLSS